MKWDIPSSVSKGLMQLKLFQGAEKPSNWLQLMTTNVSGALLTNMRTIQSPVPCLLCFVQASFENVPDKILLIAVFFFFLRSFLITVAGEERSKSGDFCPLFSALRHPLMHGEKRLKSHAGSLLLTHYMIIT